MTQYWINTVSRDHVRRGVEGGFTQANHGKPHMLLRMKSGDGVAFYSPKTEFSGQQPLQRFTAIGFVKDDDLYQVEMSPGFIPWRRNVRFLESEEIPIQPLINSLSFIKDPSRWGYMFRLGMFEIPEADFKLIAQQMNARA
jgi:hypothetical protein